jgi:hypothetical protein
VPLNAHAHAHAHAHEDEDEDEDVDEDVDVEEARLREPEPGACKLNQRQVVSRGLLVASRYGAEAFEVVKEDLDEVPHAVEAPVQARLPRSIGLRVNYGLHVAMAYFGNELIRVISRVSYERVTTGEVEQF